MPRTATCSHTPLKNKLIFHLIVDKCRKAIQEAQERMNQLKPLLGGNVSTVQTAGTHEHKYIISIADQRSVLHGLERGVGLGATG